MGLLLIFVLTIFGIIQTALINFVLSIVIILGTLITLDLLNKYKIKKSRLDLDIGNYVTGYAVVLTVLIVL